VDSVTYDCKLTRLQITLARNNTHLSCFSINLYKFHLAIRLSLVQHGQYIVIINGS